MAEKLDILVHCYTFSYSANHILFLTAIFLLYPINGCYEFSLSMPQTKQR